MQPEPAPAVNSEAPASKSVFASKTFWILLVGGFLAPVLKRFGVEFSDADTQQTAERIAQAVTFLGAVWARSKAQGPLHFNPGPAAVLLAFFAVLLLGGCAQFKVRGGLSYSNGEESVDVTTDGKRIFVHGGVDLDGNNVGGTVSLPLPRHRKEGYAK